MNKQADEVTKYLAGEVYSYPDSVQFSSTSSSSNISRDDTLLAANDTTNTVTVATTDGVIIFEIPYSTGTATYTLSETGLVATGTANDYDDPTFTDSYTATTYVNTGSSSGAIDTSSGNFTCDYNETLISNDIKQSSNTYIGMYKLIINGSNLGNAPMFGSPSPYLKLEMSMDNGSNWEDVGITFNSTSTTGLICNASASGTDIIRIRSNYIPDGYSATSVFTASNSGSTGTLYRITATETGETIIVDDISMILQYSSADSEVYDKERDLLNVDSSSTLRVIKGYINEIKLPFTKTGVNKIMNSIKTTSTDEPGYIAWGDYDILHSCETTTDAVSSGVWTKSSNSTAIDFSGNAIEQSNSLKCGKSGTGSTEFTYSIDTVTHVVTTGDILSVFINFNNYEDYLKLDSGNPLTLKINPTT